MISDASDNDVIKCKDYSVSLKDLISGEHDKHVIEQCSLGQTAKCYLIENLAAAVNACINLISFSLIILVR